MTSGQGGPELQMPPETRCENGGGEWGKAGAPFEQIHGFVACAHGGAPCAVPAPCDQAAVFRPR